MRVGIFGYARLRAFNGQQDRKVLTFNWLVFIILFSVRKSKKKKEHSNQLIGTI